MKRPSRIFGLLLVLVLAGPCGVPAVFADRGDHDRARRALEAGQIMPLSRILEVLERDYPGQVMEVELEREEGRWIYEIKLLQRGGRMLKLAVDAADAGVLEVKGREAGEASLEGRTR